MKDRLLLLILFLILGTSAFAQTTGQVTPVILSNGSATLTLDFLNQDYELILYPTVTDESDTARTFSYTVSGPAVTAKPIALHAPKPAPPSNWDHLEAQLREEERILSERLRLQGGYRPPVQKIALAQQIDSTRSFVFNSFGNVTSDQNITATLVATSSRAVAYLDNALPDTVKLATAQIQSHVDRFSTSTYDAVTGVFGAPHDVDADGKVIFLYTHLVDQVGGTAGFYSSSSVLSTDQGGNGNVADMMFIGTDHDPAFFESLLAHEFQHLISFNQHVLVNNGTSEVSWLNEAMSHVCEDLVNQHVEGGNRTLVEKFLDAPSVYSLIGSAGRSNGIRGVAYLFARNLMESFGSDIPSRLVQTGRSGIENVEAVTGQNFLNLYQTFVSRLFLTGSGLNNSLNYTFPFFTESTTSKRAIPPPRESGISPEAVTVTGAVKPMATAFLRLMGQGETPITITTESAGNFNAILIPIPQNFRHQLALAADFFPGITLDAALEGLFTSGESVRISGTVTDPSQKQLLLRLDPLDGMGDTLRFQTSIVDGKFGRSIVFHPSQAKDYKLNFFMGPETGDLPFIGRFSPVTVIAGTGPVNLPVDFFSTITLDAAFPGTITAGEGLPFSGTVSDPSIGELLLRFAPLQGSQDTIKFTIGVTDGKFSRSILFSNAQANDYELDMFAGQKDQPKPFLDGFSPIAVVPGTGPLQIPTDFFTNLVLDAPLPAEQTAGQSVKVSGQISDATISEILFRFIPLSGQGDTLRFSADVTNGRFERTLFFHPTQAGNYELGLFMGQSGQSLPFVDDFSPITISAGDGTFTLPVDFFPGLTLEKALPGVYQAGEGVSISGTVSDPSVSQVLFRFEPRSGGEAIRFFSDVTNGQFRRGIVFEPTQGGDYDLVVFGGPQGESLSQIGRFSFVTVNATGSERVSLPVDFFPGIVFDNPIDASFFAGREVRLTGQTTNTSITQILFRFDPPGGEAIRFFANATNGRFDQPISFDADQTGTYEMVIFAGLEGESLPFVGSYSSVEVLAAQAELTLRTSTLNFGSIEAGATEERRLTIVNTGTETLEINNVSGASEPFGAILPTVIPVFRIAPGDSVEVQVTFTPNTAGDFSGALIITGNNVPDAQITLIGTSPSTSTDPTPVVLSPDFNGDGLVNFSDFLAFAAAFGTRSGDAFYNAIFDLDSSGDIAFPDFLTFATAFGKPVEG